MYKDIKAIQSVLNSSDWQNENFHGKIIFVLLNRKNVYLKCSLRQCYPWKKIFFERKLECFGKTKKFRFCFLKKHFQFRFANHWFSPINTKKSPPKECVLLKKILAKNWLRKTKIASFSSSTWQTNRQVCCWFRKCPTKRRFGSGFRASCNIPQEELSKNF